MDSTSKSAAHTPGPLTARERRELMALQRKWATLRASASDIERCRELEMRDASRFREYTARAEGRQ